MCGITGVFLADSNQTATTDLFEGLGLLQHRGQVESGLFRDHS
jgi:amidophosphoribosyltransferase